MPLSNAAHAEATADDACRKAMNFQLAGDLDRAAQLYRSILQTQPTHAVANHCLGMLNVQLRRPAEGMPFLVAALTERPEIPDYWLGYLEALLQAGQVDAAEEALALGQEHGLSGKAVEEFAARLAGGAPKRAVSHPPVPTAPRSAQPSKLSRSARRSQARILRRNDALLAMMAQRRFSEALVQARSMTKRFPENGLGWKVFGALLWAEGFADEALIAMQASTRFLPRDAEAHSNLGSSFAALKRFDEAEIWLRRALTIDPAFAPVHYRLGMYYELQARYEEAEASLRAATSLRSDPLSVDDEQGSSNLLYVMSHNPNVDASALFAEHCKVGEYFEAGLRATWPRHSNTPDPERRLRIGLVSGDFRNHSVSTFLEPVVARLGRRSGVELHAYCNYAAEDRMSARLRGHFKHWHSIAALSNIDLAKRITDDGIDILIDLSGHTAKNRLPVFARKPAPIQVSWLGYPGTTGLQAMDYYLADRHWLPPGEFDHLFTEKLVYLPDRWAFQPHADAPAVNALPALGTGHLTFGSFHRLGKINASSIHLWSDLLLALPQATMLMAGISAGAEQLTLIEKFAAHGIEPGRLRFHDRCPVDRYLALHHQVDIALDTQAYAGATTTMHSLSMGVPTLTIAGATSMARAGAGILANVGLDGFTAANAADFVAKGIYWANHLTELAALRAGLRTRLSLTPGGEPDLIAAHLEGALRQMWRQWCAARPADSFHSAASDHAATPGNATSEHGATPDACQESTAPTGRHGEAENLCRDQDALLALIPQRRFGEALLQARSMTERFPEHGLGWKILGALLWGKGCADESLAAMRTSIRLMPQDPESLSNLGVSLTKLKRYEEAEHYLRKAIGVDPAFAPAHYRLGMTYELQGRYADAEAVLRTAISLRSESLSADDEQGYSNLLFLLGYNPDIDPESLFAEHCRFAESFETPLRGSWPQHSNARDPERCLQVGFVSGDFRNHSVATFLEPVARRLAQRPTLELHAYFNHGTEDGVTARLREYFKHWHPISTLSDVEFAQRIMDDRIDILIDLSGHTALNRLRAFARKAAPIQVSWLGYPGTTGLQAVDYYLADRHWLPSRRFDRLFTEKLAYLPHRWAFEPHAAAPAVSALPALENGHLTFGSFHRLGKINASTVRLWSRLLLALPRATMLVAGVSADNQQNPLLEQFAAHGIPPKRLQFHCRCNMDEYLALHHQVDIGLDTHPYSGATTTMHSLSMGVATLTIAGATSTARAGAGILGQLGLDAFVAGDAEEFVAKGLYWANHLTELAALRAELRSRLLASPGGQPDLIAAHLDGALRHMWRRWCAGMPAESFDSVALEAAGAALGRQRGSSGAAVEQFADRSVPAAPPPLDALTTLIAQNRMAEALVLARTLTERFPQHGLGWKYLGGLLYAQGLIDEALAAMFTSALLLPHDAEALCNLGISLEAVNRFDEAATWLRKALTIDPEHAAAHYRLGMYHERQGRYSEAAASIRTAMSLRPRPLSVSEEQCFSNLLYLMAYDAEVDADSLFAEHCRFGETFEAPLRGSWPRHSNSPDPERPLRVGFVSGDLRDHSVGMFLESIAARLARRTGLELHAYQNSAAEDGVTARLRGHFKHWHPIATLSGPAVAQHVMDDGIDILIDLYGHTGLNRLPAFARKPAPIQVSWLGYPGTTGLQAMDYYLADRHWLPPGQFDRLFTEKLVYLPDRWAFETHGDAPAVNSLPALRTSRLTFGSFHRMAKINAFTVRVWSDLLLALPDATLLLTGILAGAQQDTLRQRFASHGVSPTRLAFQDRCSMAVYLALHHQVDIALDTHPYAGGTTTMHSLSMGVPTLTIAGPTSFARAGAGILAQAGLEGFTASDAVDFVSRGVHWSKHLTELAQLRASIRARLKQSSTGQPDLIAAHFEGALRHMWRRWCARLPAESFHSTALEAVQ
jgi:predicted O-linked N-acetylglucosamine transferase (SPINDLY family)